MALAFPISSCPRFSRPVLRALTGAGGLFVVLTGCGATDIGSPVTAVNRPLAEQIEEREAEQALAEETGAVPEALAFTDTLAPGTFLRLDIREGGDAVLVSGPGESFDPITSIEPGIEVLATGNQTGEWLHVLYAGFDGWIRSDLVATGPIGIDDGALVEASEIEAVEQQFEVVGDVVGVNIRSGPDVSFDLITGASAGSRVTGTGRTEGSWFEVTFDGQTGWASSTYLRPVSP